mmetsp:Transcript_115684/g.180763  ORF Transcript_115684/g.180763 Transcript_115684/m.180763 type:complete len:416 (+) Transcript_115684:28-1275(+)
MKGEDIIKEGDDGTKMYFLNHGAVEILVGPEEKQVTLLRKGNLFGELALLGNGKRTCTVRALEVCDCRVVSAEAFHLVLRRFPEERAYFQEMAEQRRKESDREEGAKPQQQHPYAQVEDTTTNSFRRGSNVVRASLRLQHALARVRSNSANVPLVNQISRSRSPSSSQHRVSTSGKPTSPESPRNRLSTASTSFESGEHRGSTGGKPTSLDLPGSARRLSGQRMQVLAHVTEESSVTSPKSEPDMSAAKREWDQATLSPPLDYLLADLFCVRMPASAEPSFRKLSGPNTSRGTKQPLGERSANWRASRNLKVDIETIEGALASSRACTPCLSPPIPSSNGFGSEILPVLPAGSSRPLTPSPRHEINVNVPRSPSRSKGNVQKFDDFWQTFLPNVSPKVSGTSARRPVEHYHPISP